MRWGSWMRDTCTGPFAGKPAPTLVGIHQLVMHRAAIHPLVMHRVAIHPLVMHRVAIHPWVMHRVAIHRLVIPL
ncbi:hypothetical protein CHN49_20405 [Pseudomonas putida]|nr:hypothetical protein CHN49_20405 [Pseudomonas putida]